jgi:DNA-binding GntR family transcriptional regulator
VQVINITEEDVDELCELRMIVDGHCIKKVIQTFTVEDCLRLEEIVKNTEEMLITKIIFLIMPVL